MKRLRRIEIHTSRLANDQLVGTYASVFKGRGLAFDEVRMYQPGDDRPLHRLERHGLHEHPHVKVFSGEEREMTVMLLVDLSGSQDFGTVGAPKRQLVAEVAAVLAFSAVKNNDRVGLVLFTDDVERVVPPRKGPRHVMRVVTEILEARPKGRGSDVSRALELLGHVARRRAVAFVVSDFFDEGYEHALRVSAARHDVVPVTVTDLRESRARRRGAHARRRPRDWRARAGRHVEPAVREAYKRRALAQKLEREGLFRRLGLDSIAVSTAQYDKSAYVRPLVEFFRRRARRMHLRSASHSPRPSPSSRRGSPSRKTPRSPTRARSPTRRSPTPRAPTWSPRAGPRAACPIRCPKTARRG
ncbi:MAG: VWA domain-containing protein [Polyangiales bacterium]